MTTASFSNILKLSEDIFNTTTETVPFSAKDFVQHEQESIKYILKKEQIAHESYFLHDKAT